MDAESGITVGSIAQAVVEDKMANKKGKEVGSDFYRFQRREAQRNGRMNLIWKAFPENLFLHICDIIENLIKSLGFRRL